MRKIYLCIIIPPVGGCFLVGCWGAYVAPSDSQLIGLLAIYGMIVMTFFMMAYFPVCIIEKADRFVVVNSLLKGLKTDKILYDEIDHIDYPFWQEEGNDKTRSIRFVMKDGSEYLSLEYFFGLGALVKRWNKWNKGAAQEKESHYHATGAEFAVKPYYWATSNSYLLVMLCVVVCMCLWRIVSAPSTIFPYMALLSLLFMAYPVAMPLTTFVVANDELRSENFLARSNNHTIALAEVQWIRLSQNSMLVKKTDGDTANIHCFLSKMQVEQFKDQLEAMGITCILT